VRRTALVPIARWPDARFRTDPSACMPEPGVPPQDEQQWSRWGGTTCLLLGESKRAAFTRDQSRGWSGTGCRFGLAKATARAPWSSTPPPRPERARATDRRRRSLCRAGRALSWHRAGCGCAGVFGVQFGCRGPALSLTCLVAWCQVPSVVCVLGGAGRVRAGAQAYFGPRPWWVVGR